MYRTTDCTHAANMEHRGRDVRQGGKTRCSLKLTERPVAGANLITSGLESLEIELLDSVSKLSTPLFPLGQISSVVCELLLASTGPQDIQDLAWHCLAIGDTHTKVERIQITQ